MRYVDEIIFLDNGQIVSKGSHNFIVNSNPKYKKCMNYKTNLNKGAIFMHVLFKPSFFALKCFDRDIKFGK